MKTHNPMHPPEPRFKVGDEVIVSVPGSYRNQIAVVIEVLNHWGDFVYRYRVRFPDETSITCFGFELQLKESWPAAS